MFELIPSIITITAHSGYYMKVLCVYCPTEAIKVSSLNPPPSTPPEENNSTKLTTAGRHGMARVPFTQMKLLACIACVGLQLE